MKEPELRRPFGWSDSPNNTLLTRTLFAEQKASYSTAGSHSCLSRCHALLGQKFWSCARLAMPRCFRLIRHTDSGPPLREGGTRQSPAKGRLRPARLASPLQRHRGAAAAAEVTQARPGSRKAPRQPHKCPPEPERFSTEASQGHFPRP
ncbi:Hypothetical predicted protein [Podarcis lilfordi]|uniref:Uncharacterized protein n=1 Tax=Podarcis lilfordi TaxID=74358 RepID=A0AA35K9H0_9SAUR|nr:Hypothetical predicted protein [Podarcis lilfordi]